MTTPLVVLALITLVGGFLFLVPWGGYAGMEPYLAHDLEVYSGDLVQHHDFAAGAFLAGVATNPLTYVSVVVALLGIWLAYAMYVRGRPDPARVRGRNRGLHVTLREKYYLDAFTHGLGRFVAIVIAGVSAIFDRYVLDGLINGGAKGVGRIGERMRRWQNGIVTTYAATIIVGVAVLLVTVHFIFPYLGW